LAPPSDLLPLACEDVGKYFCGNVNPPPAKFVAIKSPLGRFPSHCPTCGRVDMEPSCATLITFLAFDVELFHQSGFPDST